MYLGKTWPDATLMGRHPVDILRATRIFLASPELWTKRARARRPSRDPEFLLQGEPCRPEDPRAFAWSAEGALALFSNPYGITPVCLLETLDRACIELGIVELIWPTGDPTTEIWESFSQYQDRCKHEQMLDILEFGAELIRRGP